MSRGDNIEYMGISNPCPDLLDRSRRVYIRAHVWTERAVVMQSSVCCKAYMYMLISYQKYRYIGCGVFITEIYIYCSHDLLSAVSLLEALSFEIHFCCV